MCYIWKGTVRPRHDRPGAEQHEVAAAQPAAEIAFGLLDVAVPAEPGIARLGDDQSLACIRLCAELGPQQRQGLEQPRTERGRADHGAMGAGATPHFALLHQTPPFTAPHPPAHSPTPP